MYMIQTINMHHLSRHHFTHARWKKTTTLCEIHLNCYSTGIFNRRTSNHHRFALFLFHRSHWLLLVVSTCFSSVSWEATRAHRAKNICHSFLRFVCCWPVVPFFVVIITTIFIIAVPIVVVVVVCWKAKFSFRFILLFLKLAGAEAGSGAFYFD